MTNLKIVNKNEETNFKNIDLKLRNLSIFLKL